MAVVTEPPWVNQTSGVAARNGTTSHTIPFGFTSTSGNELVFVVFGAVTHTVASGWTERLQPVNSGELSVFTRTSAGDTSITVTHNGSNYPVCWAAYELPAGSSWTAGTSSSPTSDTFPALSGLPGAAVVVFGARGRTSVSTGGTGASSTVSPPWVEDADVFAVDDGTTDGSYLYVTHQINVTATSVTPAAATTYVGSWSTSDRQHVVFALGVAAAGGGGTTHTGAASGSSTSAGSAAVTLSLAAAASGASTSVGAAAGGRLMAAATTGASASSGSAAATIATGPVTHQAAASGASTSAGSSAVTATLAASASGASAATGTAAATVVPPGPVTYQAGASGSSTSGGSAALVLRMTVAASGASVSAGSAIPGWLLAAAASGASTSSGLAVAAVLGQVVARPNTGTTGRPAGGTTGRSNTGTVTRP